MPDSNALTSAQHQSLYRATVQEAAADGAAMMGKLVAAARVVLQAREVATFDLQARNALADSAKQLRLREAELCKRFPQVLLEAFSTALVPKKRSVTSPADLQFDELELMNELQVQASVTLARTMQVTMLATDASLADFNTLICRTLGLAAVQPERNPLRPEVYVGALKEIIEQSGVPEHTQLDWMSAMSTTLGQELRDLYFRLSSRLRDEGVVSAGYVISQPPGGATAGHGVAPGPQSRDMSESAHTATPQPAIVTRQAGGTSSTVHQQRKDSSLLTLDKLRQLLSGTLKAPVAPSHLDAFNHHFAREFEQGNLQVEASSSDFEATVPAALEALNEMRQVDDMVQRLEQRRAAGPGSAMVHDSTVDLACENLRGQAKNVAQALSLEVVALMVDNIAMDARLLEPVQQLVRNLEPALMRLALVDPRLFTDKSHPARLMVQEITHRSMAYATADSTGFVDFLKELEAAIAPLRASRIESVEPFERVLETLQGAWMRAERASARQREDAVVALRHAEQRNLLAVKIAREIEAHPNASQVPEVVMNFLCGPWAQVIAQARLTGGADTAAADKFTAIIPDLLWSTHPELTRKNYAKLTRMVPLLLTAMREGLETIHYPAARTSEFLEALLGLHQLAFRAAQKTPDAPAEPPPVPMAHMPSAVRPTEDGDPWMAPQEARATNFMEFADVASDHNGAVVAGDQTVLDEQRRADGTFETPAEAVVAVEDLSLGSWIELLVAGEWVRTQLTWASPHGTLYLFTSVFGTPQSMTRRSLDRLVASGSLRVISGRPVVDGALNAVAQQAMRNSVDTEFGEDSGI